MMADDPRTRIESHWQAANRRDWTTFEALLHPQLQYEVPQTREYIEGAAGYVDMFRTWPGDWQAQVRSLLVDGDDAATTIDFRSHGESMTGITFFRLEGGRIRGVTDYWPGPYEPPMRSTPHMKRRPRPAHAAPGGKVDAARVSLREINADTLRPVLRLAVAKDQQRFVASNAVSLAQALFAPDAWYRAIYVDDEPAGFVMLEDQSLREPPPADAQIGVWRFMVAERFQGRGVGQAAMRLVIAHARSRERFDKLSLSYVAAPGGPDGFYRSLGFRDTGRIDEGELVMELPL
ncbi:MAG: GNAT family N-acetyltransferase [Burkholderiales bacterium]|nr:GNAT family N-acetyltransferase [Burkholderiales bacterium]